LGGGISLARDGNGWITRTDAEGRVLSARWLDHLDAPSGMIAAGPMLYVCDRDGLLEVDIASGAVKHTFVLPGAEFINDVARAANGDLFVSDFFGNRIYRIPAATRIPEVFIEGEQLDTPDGLLVDGSDLIVATWGRLSDRATFATSKLGKLLRISLTTREITPVVSGTEEIGNLEGIAHVKGAYYVTDWMSGRLLRITPNGVEVVLRGLHHPTDPGYAPEHSLLAIPDHGTNRVLFLRVP
jgi:hypothetical protein